MRTKKIQGTTLIEVVMAMVVLGLIGAGIFSALVFSRSTHTRAEGQILVQTLIQGLNETLRTTPAFMDPSTGTQVPWLPPGRFVNGGMRGGIPGGWNVLTDPAGNDLLQNAFPPGFVARYLSSRDGDGIYLIVEGAVDLDGDGLQGIDVNGDGRWDPNVDLRRVRVRVRWLPP